MSHESKTEDWLRVEDFIDVLVHKDANRRITKANFAKAISSSLVAEGFNKSTLALSKLSIVTTSVNLSVTNSHSLICVDCSGGSVTLSFAAAATFYDSIAQTTQVIIVKRIDTSTVNQCLIVPDGSETINLQSSLALPGPNLPNAFIITDGSNLFTISQ
jgi:dethiobiotin synthetase